LASARPEKVGRWLATKVMIGSPMGLQEVAVVETHEMLFRRLPRPLIAMTAKKTPPRTPEQNYFAALLTREGLDSFE
jgi:hypothetical protein